MKSFKEKVAVITGAGSGMGRYLAVLLAKDGADVVLCDVNETTLNETKEMLRKYNVSVSSHLLDVSDKHAIEALPEKVIEQHGKVDLVFNNAGVTTGSHFKDMDEDNWDWVMGINFDGVINSTRAFIPHMIDRPEAAIVNTSSIFGMVAVPGQTVYHATKFAVRGFTESLAMELRDDPIQINCVYPGHIGTNIVLDARFKKEILLTNGEYAKDSNGKPLTVEDVGSTFRETGMNPNKAAKIILKGVKKNKRRIFVGLDAKVMEIAQRLSPSHYIRIIPILNLLIFPYFLKRIKMMKTFYSIFKARR